MRVLTLNVWALHGDWPRRRAALAAGIADLDPDLVALQETIVGADYDQARDVLRPDYRIVHQQARDAQGMGITIASRWSVTEVRELDLHLTPRTGAFPCTTLVAEIAAPAPVGQLLFVNHFPSYQPELEHERQLQAVAAARFIGEVQAARQMPVIVAGDLDADPSAGSIRFWTGREALDGMSVCYRDVWEAAHPDEPGDTFTSNNPLRSAREWPFRRIDYILVGRNSSNRPLLAIRGARLVFDAPIDGTWASDHFGVLADLEPSDAAS
jgi:endonuclease/exonuclease/phosphatase family metal-dependent hydrolase